MCLNIHIITARTRTVTNNYFKQHVRTGTMSIPTRTSGTRTNTPTLIGTRTMRCLLPFQIISTLELYVYRS